jgi:DNA-directed RNA polymerase subunit RPC12/RpoP
MMTSQKPYLRLEDHKAQRMIERIAIQKAQTTSQKVPAETTATVDEIRCPYCIEGDHFKVMTPRETHLVCLKCGHVVVLDRTDYDCQCRKCLILYGRPRLA